MLEIELIVNSILVGIILITQFISYPLFLKVDFTDFITQYILYPQSIGSDRFNSMVIKFESFFNQFK